MLSRHRLAALTVIAGLGVLGAGRAVAAPSATSTPTARAAVKAARATPDLTKAVHYLVTTTGANGNSGGTSLTKNGYYESFPGFADFGLTIDGAFALAATDRDDKDLRKVVDFIRLDKKDGSGRTADEWTSIGTDYVSGGSIAKEALLAEVTGYDPRAFAGHDLIKTLAGLVCTKTIADSCGGAGNYLDASSVFSQALGVMAQLRAGDSTGADKPVAYLESLQAKSGAFPSLIPTSGDTDPDSTAMAAMALALLPADAKAKAAVAKAEAWLAGKQRKDGGYLGTAGDSTNSAALAIQGLSLAGTKYAGQIAKARVFLAGQQDSDGGFEVAAGGQPGSDVRASTQVVGGVVGTSFGVLRDDIAPHVVITPPPSSPTSTSTRSSSSTSARTRSSAASTSTRTRSSADSTTRLSAGSITTTSSTARPTSRSSSTVATSVDPLAATGSSAGDQTGTAGALLLAGFVLLGLGRRRRQVGRHR